MASSRWKRFAFFERHTLSLPSEVLEDLIPIDGPDGRSSQRALNALNRPSEGHNKKSNDSVSLVVTTAALPRNSKPSSNARASGTNNEDHMAVTDMWSSMTACSPMDIPWDADNDGPETIRLPNQTQAMDDSSNITTTGPAFDGLVLVFVTSRDTDFVHCFDLTLRCNPPESSPDDNADKKDLEDMDGWRGYITPLKGQHIRSPQASSSARSLEERIITDHMEEEKIEGIVGIATCRATNGHKPIYMACITESNLIVCKDPHLYLSW